MLIFQLKPLFQRCVTGEKILIMREIILPELVEVDEIRLNSPEMRKSVKAHFCTLKSI
jgi:hypothetical protein